MMLMHEMQVIKHLSRVCSSEVSAAGEVVAQSMRARIIQEGLSGVDSAAFTPLLEFVIEQGASGDHAFCGTACAIPRALG